MTAEPTSAGKMAESAIVAAIKSGLVVLEVEFHARAHNEGSEDRGQ